jgi:hypothetical protein
MIGWLLLAVAGRLISESADGVAARKTAGTACSTLMPARRSLLFYEAQLNQRVNLTGVYLILHLSLFMSSSNSVLFA